MKFWVSKFYDVLASQSSLVVTSKNFINNFKVKGSVIINHRYLLRFCFAVANEVKQISAVIASLHKIFTGMLLAFSCFES